MNLDRALDLLICPVCRDPLSRTEGQLLCPQGHSFDIARQGYVNLTGGAQPANADTAAMLDARARVHAAGVFDPVIEMVATLARGRSRILEAGAGIGSYLHTALGEDPSAVGLALDISKHAARRCAKIDPRVAALVADIWAPLPIADHSLDVVLAVFAPRNLPEFARVLRFDGRYIAVTPRPPHLAGLRDSYGLLDIPSAKSEQLTAAAAEFFDLVDTRVVKYRRSVDETLAADLIAMGPNAFHHPPAQVTASVVNIDVTVQSFRPFLG